ncbi:hypothetical protein, partial [Nitrosomonas sp.]|uniref:hypothetical protein n=1 Tax=Nitrosomonas sp. TaxID=42353 RepID=UPI0033058D09
QALADYILQIQQPAIRKTTNQINKLQVVQGRLIRCILDFARLGAGCKMIFLSDLILWNITVVAR